jgi:hypothetical protein
MKDCGKMPAAEVTPYLGERRGNPAQGEIEEYLRIAEVFTPLPRRLTRFIDETLGSKGVIIAFKNFIGLPERTEWQKMRKMGSFLIAHQMLLYNWTFFNLLYRPIPIAISDTGSDLPSNITLSELFLEKHKNSLPAAETEIIRTISRKPFSFAEVKQCNKGHSIVLRDLLKRQEMHVFDASLSFFACEGDIYYCRIIRINDLSFLFNAYSPYAIPQFYKPHIIAFRTAIKEGSHSAIDDEVLLDYGEIIRKEYFELCKRVFLSVRLQ